MPPKAKAPSKAESKAKQKVVEDKTFGLKNKNKSKAVQKYIKSVEARVTGGRVKNEHELRAEQKEKAEEKKRQKQAALLASLQKAQDALKTVGTKTDNKAISEAQKVDIYVDPRTLKQQDTINEWDQSKLEQVVKTKHGSQKCTSDIVCKYFLDALEKKLYGWFWQCPNGENCQYRHALPPGYVLKRKDPVENLQDLDDEEPIEEIIERERARLPPGGTPVTLESFTEWKKRKEQEAKEVKEAAQKKREKETGRLDMSGRALFAFNPELFNNKDGDEDDDGDENDDIAAMLAERKRADQEAELLAARQAAEQLAVASNETLNDQSAPVVVHNPKLFQDQGEQLDVNDLED